jgi:DNA-binding HxlR family transcriptional regulator
VKRKSLDGSACFIARSLDQVGEWWSLLIIRDLFRGRRRFGELLESLGVARNILSVRLKRLVSCGIVQLRPADDGSYQEYELTEKGRGLFVTLVALDQWGRRWVDPESDVPYLYVDRATRQEIAPVEVRSRDGRRLSLDDLAVALRAELPPV